MALRARRGTKAARRVWAYLTSIRPRRLRSIPCEHPPRREIRQGAAARAKRLARRRIRHNRAGSRYAARPCRRRWRRRGRYQRRGAETPVFVNEAPALRGNDPPPETSDSAAPARPERAISALRSGAGRRRGARAQRLSSQRLQKAAQAVAAPRGPAAGDERDSPRRCCRSRCARCRAAADQFHAREHMTPPWRASSAKRSTSTTLFAELKAIDPGRRALQTVMRP